MTKLDCANITQFLVSNLVLFLILNLVFNVLLFNNSNATLCTAYLGSKYELPIEDWPIAQDYQDLQLSITEIVQQKSVGKLVSLFKNFASNYHHRYQLQLNALVSAYPVLDSDLIALRGALNSFQRQEESIVNLFRQELLNLPAKKRMQFLKRQTTEKLSRLENILDALMGLNISHLNHQIPWSQLIQIVEDLEISEGELLVDLGSDMGRFGLLIGLLRPDVNYIGLEFVHPLVFESSKAARENGFTKVKFIQMNLADEMLELPSADHFYVLNLTSVSSGDFLTQKLIELSRHKKFKVHLLSGLNSKLFYDKFKKIYKSSGVSTYIIN